MPKRLIRSKTAGAWPSVAIPYRILGPPRILLLPEDQAEVRTTALIIEGTTLIPEYPAAITKGDCEAVSDEPSRFGLAADYWCRNPQIKDNFVAVSSKAAYMHSLDSPLYMSSKAGLVSFVKSLSELNDFFGIRVAAVCPGTVRLSRKPTKYLSFVDH
jgi:NAD(P)-dependent dehydrogenase (short-subunit alcohol dehydrogenase family)